MRWLPAAAAREMRSNEQVGGNDGVGRAGSRRSLVEGAIAGAGESPCPPDYVFEGAIAGDGEDWEKTAARAVSMESSKQDE